MESKNDGFLNLRALVIGESGMCYSASTLEPHDYPKQCSSNALPPTGVARDHSSHEIGYGAPCPPAPKSRSGEPNGREISFCMGRPTTTAQLHVFTKSPPSLRARYTIGSPPWPIISSGHMASNQPSHHLPIRPLTEYGPYARSACGPRVTPSTAPRWSRARLS